jgi:hypothetical protein
MPNSLSYLLDCWDWFVPCVLELRSNPLRDRLLGRHQGQPIAVFEGELDSLFFNLVQ